jgi:CRISPR-associated exonuclease Cas4
MLLRDLRRRVRSTAPSILLAEAIERLNVRAILVARGADQASRALANIDAIVERARAYSVRGFKAFAAELNANWSGPVSQAEGVVDADGQSIELVTIHSSKGLEWPVVIPINMASYARQWGQFFHRRSDDTMHWCLGEIVPPSLDGVIEDDSREESEQRLRLLYVACTRAMELLAIPELAAANQSSWARALDLKLSQVPELDLNRYSRTPVARAPKTFNQQTSSIFAEQRTRIDQAYPKVGWIRPSDADPDLVQFETVPSASADASPEPIPVMGRGSLRGMILHKLMEECLMGLLDSSVAAIENRASDFLGQFPTTADVRPDAQELAATTLRTLSLEAVSEDRSNLVAEVSVYGALDASGERLIAGRADAARFRNEKPDIVFDWKSDVSPRPEDRTVYAAQVAQYVRVLGARRGAVVYMTPGEIQWVDPAP